jgi:hypothetical protein
MAALAVQVLDAPQQLHKGQPGLCFAVTATLQHSVKELTACHQLCDEVHLQSSRAAVGVVTHYWRRGSRQLVTCVLPIWVLPMHGTYNKGMQGRGGQGGAAHCACTCSALCAFLALFPSSKYSFKNTTFSWLSPHKISISLKISSLHDSRSCGVHHMWGVDDECGMAAAAAAAAARNWRRESAEACKDGKHYSSPSALVNQWDIMGYCSRECRWNGGLVTSNRAGYVMPACVMITVCSHCLLAPPLQMAMSLS